EQMLPKLLGAATQRDNPDVVAAVRELGSAQKPATIVAALKALRDRPEATPGLKGVKGAAVVVVRAGDTLTAPGRAGARTNGAPRAVIDKAGHLANAEQPGAFNDVLMAFLAGVS